jgi:hypothetical protein
LPLDYAYDAPVYWSPEVSSSPNSYLNTDICVIRDHDFFVRGLIEIPLIGSDRAFRYGAWVSLSKKNFDRMIDLWDNPSLLDEPPYFGWLSNSIDLYPETLNLKTNVSFRDIGQRPYIELEPTDHPLAIEQREGISVDRVRQIAERSMHRTQ